MAGDYNTAERNDNDDANDRIEGCKPSTHDGIVIASSSCGTSVNCSHSKNVNSHSKNQ